MALKLNPTRLRRILSLSSSFVSSIHRPPPSSTTITTNSLLQTQRSPSPSSSQFSCSSIRFLHSTHLYLSSSRHLNDVDKIDPDTILFEGCDYKHWLIVMDFGNDPAKRPPPEEMVETYVQTLAKVVGSVEEAKKRMYACSTTTYTGFQAEMDEETSNKFEGMPGVIFVLPDSYIDPVNKEYGGDKYINGTIIPRPPPVQYGRVKRGRQNDQRPSGQYDQRPSGQYDQRPSGQMPSQQGNRNYNQSGSMPGDGRSYMPQGGVPQQQHYPSNYGPDQGGRSNPMPNRMTNHEQRRGNYPGGGNAYAPPHPENYSQGNYHQGEHNYNHPQGQIRNPGGGYPPQGQMNYPGDSRSYAPPPPPRGDYPGGSPPQGQMNYPGDSRNYAPPPPPRGAYGQAGDGSYQQYGDGRYPQGPNVAYDQGANVGYPDGSPQVENQRFSQAPDDQNTRSTENRNYTPAAQTGMNQGRF